jgi:hypothetical protein
VKSNSTRFRNCTLDFHLDPQEHYHYLKIAFGSGEARFTERVTSSAFLSILVYQQQQANFLVGTSGDVANLYVLKS